MDDEILDLPAIAMLRHLQAGRNKNLNRGFRKLRAPVKCAPVESIRVLLRSNSTG